MHPSDEDLSKLNQKNQNEKTFQMIHTNVLKSQSINNCWTNMEKLIFFGLFINTIDISRCRQRQLHKRSEQTIKQLFKQMLKLNQNKIEK